MIQKRILEAARPYLEGRTVTDLVLGIALIGAELDGENVGVSYMLRENLPSGCGSFAFARQAVGKDAWEVAQLLVTGTDDAQRGLAAAVLSAASHGAPLDFCPDDEARPFGVGIKPGDKLALIGYMHPIAKQFEGKVSDMVIFDMARELAGATDVVPCALQEEVLPTCDIVVASGTSVINHTVEGLLGMCPNAREFILTGTSAPLFPAGFAGSGVTSLAGTTWRQDAKEEIFRTIALGGGMSLIIFVSIVSRVPSAIFSSVQMTEGLAAGIALTALIVAIVLVCIPLIIYVERAQRRIPINYAKQVKGRQMMGGTSTFLPLKVNSAGVIPIIFASCILYLPAQLAAIFNVGWLTTFANWVSTGWLNWALTLALIVFFAYFYTSMVFNPEETANQIQKNGGFVPGIRPGKNTAAYIKDTMKRVTLPGAIFIAAIAVVPTVIFYFTGNQLIQAFGGTSILIMISVALDTMSKIESQLKQHNYKGFFK